MKGDAKQWWHTWAPFWEPFEDRHFGIAAVERVLRFVASPVLVVGAGQGILVEYLARRGHEVVGLDASRPMVAEARRRRGLELVLGDACELPFEAARFRTVLVASGVVDYQAEAGRAHTMLREGLRVLRPWGNLLVGFYRFPPKLEQVYRHIGVIEADRYHSRRLFDLGEIARQSPFRCVPLIARWTGRSRLGTTIYWANTGVRMRKVFQREARALESVMRQAERAGHERADLLAEVPDALPYRDEEQIRTLVEGAGLRALDLSVLDDCIVVRHQKSGDRTGDERESAPAARSGAASGSVPRDGHAATEWHIRTTGVRKRYRGARRDAVRSLDLSVERGVVFGILGPNGAGKTTTLMMLCGLLVPDAGTIRYAGDRDPAAVREHLGLVPQNIAAYSNLTARENLRLFGKLHGLRGKALDERTGELLERIGLSDRADDRVETYSGGMKRRLNLVTGLVHRPEIMLLDEPTVGMDPQSRNRVFELIGELRDEGTTVLYTTHYMEEASRLCDRLAIMDLGTVLVEGTPRELVDRIGTSRVELLAPGATTRFEQALRELAGVVEVDRAGDVVTLTTPPSDAALGVIDRARELGRTDGLSVTLRSVTEASLESVFLQLTGRSMRDESD